MPCDCDCAHGHGPHPCRRRSRVKRACTRPTTARHRSAFRPPQVHNEITIPCLQLGFVFRPRPCRPPAPPPRSGFSKPSTAPLRRVRRRGWIGAYAYEQPVPGRAARACWHVHARGGACWHVVPPRAAGELVGAPPWQPAPHAGTQAHADRSANQQPATARHSRRLAPRRCKGPRGLTGCSALSNAGTMCTVTTTSTSSTRCVCYKVVCVCVCACVCVCECACVPREGLDD